MYVKVKKGSHYEDIFGLDKLEVLETTEIFNTKMYKLKGFENSWNDSSMFQEL
jgi:hypothetical protein